MERPRRRALGALLFAAALAGGSGLPPAAGAESCPGVTLRGSWKSIATPVHTTAFAVDPSGRLYVAGARSISTSANGGCSWREVHRLAGVLPVEEGVTALAAVGDTVVAAVTGPHVLVSDDGGETWTRHDRGLDVPGVPVGLYGSDGIVYMVVRRQVTDQLLSSVGPGEQGVGATVSVVYRSADGGRTWTRGDVVGTAFSGPHGSETEGGSPPGAVWDLAVDPADPDHLLAAARDGVFRSTDGGATWHAGFFDPGAEVRAVAMWRSDGRPAAIAVDPATGKMYSTEDVSSGWLWGTHPQLRTEMMASYPYAAAWAWATAGAAGDVVVTGPKGVFGLGYGALEDVTPPVAATVTDPAFVPSPRGEGLWARLLDGSALVTRPAPREHRQQEGSGPGGDVVRPGDLAPAEWSGDVPTPELAEPRARLSAPVARVGLAPGETRTITYTARLGPRQVDVDLYFLIDTTASMSGTIRALVGGMHDIVSRLAASGVRLRAGVGSFRTYPRETDRVAVNHAYRRLRALGPVDEELAEALYELEAGGASGANLTALLQAVTGAGQDVLPPGPSKADVAPGLQAGYRDDALKVVMHVGDTWFGTPERGDPGGYYVPAAWPGPPFEEAAAALRAAGVWHLGIALQPGAGGTVLADADVVDDMRRMSRATSSLAGPRGADCDGDGRPDLRQGAPLVCLVERGSGAGGLAAVVIGLVEALEERGDVRLAEIGDSGLVRTLRPRVYPGVDLRAGQTLTFDLTVGCDLADAGTRRIVDLGLFAAGRKAARTDLEVACAELPSAPDPLERAPSPLALVPPIPVAPPPHPVPGPAPGSVTAPAPVQAPAPAQAPGGQPQALTVTQRQQQPQVALATAAVQLREQTQMQHALVRTRARDPLATARLWTAVGALSIVWAWGIAAATMTSLRRARR